MRGQHAAVRPRLPGDCPPGSAGQRAGSGRERAAVKVLGVAIHSGWLSWQPAAFVAVLFLCLSLSVHTFHPTQRWFLMSKENASLPLEKDLWMLTGGVFNVADFKASLGNSSR